MIVMQSMRRPRIEPEHMELRALIHRAGPDRPYSRQYSLYLAHEHYDDVWSEVEMIDAMRVQQAGGDLVVEVCVGQQRGLSITINGVTYTTSVWNTYGNLLVGGTAGRRDVAFAYFVPHWVVR